MRRSSNTPKPRRRRSGRRTVSASLMRPSWASPGTTPWPIASGSQHRPTHAFDCQPRPNANTRLGAGWRRQTGPSPTRIGRRWRLGRRSRQLSIRTCRWTPAATASVCTAWPTTCMSGAPTGTTAATTTSRHGPNLPDRSAACGAPAAAAPGGTESSSHG